MTDDPRLITFSEKTIAGRRIHFVNKQTSNPSRLEAIWNGSTNKLKEYKLQMMWEFICNQQDQIDELKEQIKYLEQHLVILTPIEKQNEGENNE